MAQRWRVRYPWAGPLPERGLPTGIAVAAGSAAVVASALVAAALPGRAGTARGGLVVATLMIFAAVAIDPAAIAAAGLLDFLIFEGFLVNRLGYLSWHGTVDAWRLAAFAAAAGAGLVAGVAYRALRDVRTWRARECRFAYRSPGVDATKGGQNPHYGAIWQTEEGARRG